MDDCDAATGEIGAGEEAEGGGGAGGGGAIPGCTDYHARNYQLNATSDDGSCLFAALHSFRCPVVGACPRPPGAVKRP